MFTGIITDIGEIAELTRSDAGARLVISTAFDIDSVDIGASIACSGVCLTVVKKAKGQFTVEVSNETLDVTTLGDWEKGTHINLERALRVGDELGGHIVSGHVDAVAGLVDATPDGDSLRLSICVPQEYACYIAPKGSVALDGVSLTVNEVNDNIFGVNIIPHTQEHTTLGRLQPGDRLNLEVDMMARYAARILGKEAA